MRRVSIILILAAVLTLALAATAMAATPPYIPADGSKVHSNYQKNTDACGACHATHTGVGASLLQWADVNATCFACHDGTVTSTYNVVGGQIGGTGAITFGGLFGIGTETYLSTHGVTASLKTNSAPGGANGATPVADAYGDWTMDFNCAACHTPHGQGGNARILSADPNGVQTAKAPGQGTNAKETLTATDATYTIYKASQGYWLHGYPYSYKTAIYVDNVKKTSGYTINYELGQVAFNPALTATSVVTAAYVPALRVTMDVANFLTATESVTYKSGINTFCGACHSDYNTQSVTDPITGKPHGSGDVLSGHYTNAYRHQVGYEYSGYAGIQGLKFQDNGATPTSVQDVVVCLTCHVAHGTDQAYWVASLANADKKADGTAYWTTTTATELAGSSALKRKPNMATCESCHKKGFGNSWDSTLNPDTQYK